MDSLPMILQLALTLASFAVIILTACLIPVLFQAGRSLNQMSANMEEIKDKVNVLLDDTRTLVRNVNELSQKLNDRMDEVGEAIDAVKSLTGRAAEGAGGFTSTIRGPVLAVMKKMNTLRTGATAFFNVLFHSRTKNNNAEEE